MSHLVTQLSRHFASEHWATSYVFQTPVSLMLSDRPLVSTLTAQQCSDQLLYLPCALQSSHQAITWWRLLRERYQPVPNY